MSETIHATCVAIGGRGVLLTGPSGAGKSDLALRLLDRGAELVSDDGTVVEARDGRLHARAGPNIARRIEVRGLGILDWPAVPETPLALIVALGGPMPRMADARLPTRTIAGLALPVLALAGFEASAPVKVEQGLMLYGVKP